MQQPQSSTQNASFGLRNFKFLKIFTKENIDVLAHTVSLSRTIVQQTHAISLLVLLILTHKDVFSKKKLETAPNSARRQSTETANRFHFSQARRTHDFWCVASSQNCAQFGSRRNHWNSSQFEILQFRAR